VRKLIYVITACVLFIVVRLAIKVLGFVIDKRKAKETEEINIQCDATEERANRIGQDIIEAMEDIENTHWMSEEEKASFLKRYQEILDDVVATKSDVERIRKQFPMEGAVKNV
jgi:cell division protein FtsX